MSLFYHWSNLQDISFDYFVDYVNIMEQNFKERIQKILNRCNGQHIINHIDFRYPVVTMLSPRELMDYHGVNAILDYITDINAIASNMRKIRLSTLFIHIPSENIYIDYSHFLARDYYTDKCHKVNKELQNNEIDIKVYPSLFGDIEFDTGSDDLIFRKTKTRCIVKDKATTANKIIEETKQLQIHVIRRKQNATTSNKF